MKKTLLLGVLIFGMLCQSATAKLMTGPTDKFPKNLYGDYWAAVEPVGDDFEYIVVNFYEQDGVIYSDSHRFYCMGDSYTHQPFRQSTNMVTIDGKRLALRKSADAPALLLLELVEFVPNTSLVLHQTAPEHRPELKQRFPDGIFFFYRHTKTLRPACAI